MSPSTFIRLVTCVLVSQILSPFSLVAQQDPGELTMKLIPSTRRADGTWVVQPGGGIEISVRAPGPGTLVLAMAATARGGVLDPASTAVLLRREVRSAGYQTTNYVVPLGLEGFTLRLQAAFLGLDGRLRLSRIHRVRIDRSLEELPLPGPSPSW